MDTSKYYQTESRFLKADNLMRKDGKYAEAKVTIASAVKEDLKDQVTGASEERISIGFEGKEQRLLLNKTNWLMLTSAFGVDSDGWIGKEVLLYVDPYVKYMDKIVPALRIRPMTPAVAENDEIPF